MDRARPDECSNIKSTFGPANGFKTGEYINWAGIDYSNKSATYNCLSSADYGRWSANNITFAKYRLYLNDLPHS
jgi:hypothetical protein